MSAWAIIVASVSGAIAAGSLGVCALALRAAERALAQADQARDDGAKAKARATLAERALTDLRIRRSRAVSKGNRTRAQTQAARRAAMTEEVARAAALKKTEPQGSLPLGAAPAKDQE